MSSGCSTLSAMTEAFVLDWVNLLLRWAHLVVGISWIGTSFFFIWLDLALRRREGQAPGIQGSAWLVHGGGFYDVAKYSVAPAFLPPELHWFRWEAYLTWATGLGLLVVMYYLQASLYLIDPARAALTPWQASAIGLLSLLAGWFLYDALVRALGDRPALLAGVLFAVIVAASWGYDQVFSGRGALIHVGALVGTWMAANVFAVIIPNQKKIVAALLAHQAPDPALGKAGKVRSVHNNYLTLPVLLLMVSNHYPFLTGHRHLWLVVALIVVAGGAVRHVLNRAEAGDPPRRYLWAAPVALAGLAALVVATAPQRLPVAAVPADGTVLAIAQRHCAVCHADRPSFPGFAQAPKEFRLETLDQLRANAARVQAQLAGGVMPPGNATGLSAEERAALLAWVSARYAGSQ
jgi:uncharacterized membrane protein